MAETHTATHGPVDLRDGHNVTHGDHGHGAVQHQFDDMAQQRESLTLGMWLFLATELMMFGGLFFAYSLYRWLYPGAFEYGSLHLNHWMGTGNTFVLLFSSLTMAFAVHSAAEGKKRPLVSWLGLTWILGLIFLVVKGFEWYHDWEIGLIPGLNWTYFENPEHHHELAGLVGRNVLPHHILMYFTIYFCMTGLHAIHMIIGLGVVAYFMWLGARGQFLNGNDQPVEIVGLYWHLVDIIWVFLFPLLYLIGGLNLPPFVVKGGH